METAMYKCNPFIQKYLNILLLFFPLTTFLVLPSIQGTTVITIFSSIIFGLIFFLPVGEVRILIIKELFQFTIVLLVLSFCSQLANLVSDLKLSDDLELVDTGDYLNTFYRLSHITQTLYLIAGFLIYILLKYFSDESAIKYIYWALRLLCFYALYEFVFYLVTGQNGDFITNRTFGEKEKIASSFQTTSIGGMSLMRLKGYTGEPSMFTFTVMPFWILSFALRRSFDIFLILLCLLLSFSTTAYFGIFAFLTFWFLYRRQYKVVIAAGLAFVAIGVVLQMEPFNSLFTGIYDFVFANKLSGEGASSRSRGGYFQTHILYWADLNFAHQLFGIGFGYIRSTDFFSTLFLNTGFLGFLIFTLFVFKNFLFTIYPKELSICYKAGLIAVYAIMMATVPEFAYPSLWIYLSLGYIIQDEKKPHNESISDSSIKFINSVKSSENSPSKNAVWK